MSQVAFTTQASGIRFALHSVILLVLFVLFVHHSALPCKCRANADWYFVCATKACFQCSTRGVVGSACNYSETQACLWCCLKHHWTVQRRDRWSRVLPFVQGSAILMPTRHLPAEQTHNRRLILMANVGYVLFSQILRCTSKFTFPIQCIVNTELGELRMAENGGTHHARTCLQKYHSAPYNEIA